MYIGIDPGVTGAIAFINPEGFSWVEDTPVEKATSGHNYLGASMAALIKSVERNGIVHACIEDIVTLPGQNPAHVAKRGRGLGIWEGILLAEGIPYTIVRPHIWKKEMGLSSDKSSSRALAQQLHPDLAACFARVKDDGRAEAALIADYGMRKGL